MVAWWCGSLLALAGPWALSFRPEVDRHPREARRRVVAVGDRTLFPAAALCAELQSPERRCEISRVQLRRGDFSDAALALERMMPGELVYVLRAIDPVTVSVSVFDGIDNRVDAYVARPHQPVNTQMDLLQLQRRIERLERQIASLSATPYPSGGPEDEGALALLEQAVQAANQLDPRAARDHLEALEARYPYSHAGRAADRLSRELDVVGRARVQPVIETWLGGEASYRDDRPTLYLFWEIWCPHSRREIVRLSALHAQRPDAFQILALTGLTQGTDLREIRPFLEEHDISLPVAVELGRTLSDPYGVYGIPAAVMVVGDTVTWRGHPAHVDDAMLDRLLSGP